MSTPAPSPPTRARSRTLALVALLGAATASATYLQGGLSVVSSFVIDEFGLTRSQLGAAFTAFSVTGAFVSPIVGVWTDKNTTRVMAALFGTSALGVVMVASAPSFVFLIVGTIVGGLALGAGNPVTNRVIADQIGVTRRGLVVGLKQAGAPLNLLVAGIVLPPLALTLGWRWALGLSALLPLAGLAVTRFLLHPPSREATSTATTEPDDVAETRSIVLWLTVISLGVAVALSAVIAFLPLYAQERVDASPATAGTLAALMGLTGVAGRIGWGAMGGRFARPSGALLMMSLLGLVATVAVALAETLGVWILWPAVIGVGGSMLAWHSVAWLVIINRVGAGGVGKASGIMQVGNSIGFAAGPLVAGVLIDATDSYQVAWATVAGLLIVASLLTVWIRIRSVPSRAHHDSEASRSRKPAGE